MVGLCKMVTIQFSDLFYTVEMLLLISPSSSPNISNKKQLGQCEAEQYGSFVLLFGREEAVFLCKAVSKEGII